VAAAPEGCQALIGVSDETAWGGVRREVERRSRASVRRDRARAGDAALLAIVLALVVVAGAVLAAREAGESERRAADRRLTAVTEAAAAEFSGAVVEAERLARSRAADPIVVRALARGDTGTLTRIAQVDAIAVVRRSRIVAGTPPGTNEPVRRSADVVDRGRTIGSVLTTVRFDDALVERLERAARVRPGEEIVLVVRGRIAARDTGARLAVPSAVATVVQDGERFRAASAQLVAGRADVRVAALTPLALIDEAATDRRNDVLLAIFATLAALALLGVAAVIWQRQRGIARRATAIEHDRRNVRDALSLVGDALASTHDTEALLPVIVETAMEAAGATGAQLLRDEAEVMRAGRPSASKTPLVLPLGEDDDGHTLKLLLYAPAGGPLPEARELAEWFVSQAAIALENARLHGIVKRQAITDPLTGLANRRRFVEALEAELSRAERFQTKLAVVIADLDDFKNVNDTYGHEVGNDVLRAFADLITGTLRDVDVAARLGGEEFAMLLPQTDLDGGLALAERIRSEFAASSIVTPDGVPLRVTSSFGVASSPLTSTVDGLLRAADGALYRAKAEGKDRVAA
jgi:diguanylate cyclase (GGDEF)-like protein